ncbi:hypothetical protein D2Q93_04325 [Alicyclobacillaceae bacterium I2511]|nr:hypothetical protein D2Q93_04325 [Alicyclobacillaceae bacterium I2511]
MTEGQDGYTPEQEVAWCKTVIRNAAIRVNQKYTRWAKDLLALNEILTEDGEEMGELIPSESTDKNCQEVELRLVFETLSP